MPIGGEHRRQRRNRIVELDEDPLTLLATPLGDQHGQRRAQALVVQLGLFQGSEAATESAHRSARAGSRTSPRRTMKAHISRSTTSFNSIEPSGDARTMCWAHKAC